MSVRASVVTMVSVLAAARFVATAPALTVHAAVASTTWYAAPDGAPGNPGTRARPWDLQTALDGGGGRVRPGDTIWVRGGRYDGTAFTTALRGRPDARITIRAAAGERATIDGRLLARGAYLDVWGLEVMQSQPTRYAGEMQLLDIRTDHGRFINLVLHDANTHGANLWTPGVDAELYGSIIYNNGTHENLDHGVYVHNDSGTKRVVDNVFFNNYARGIQVYASHNNEVLRQVHVEGNIAFNNGVISARSSRVNLLFNAQVPVERMAAVDNLLYFSPGVGGINLRAGHAPQRYEDLLLRGNQLVGGEVGLEMRQPWRRAVVERNTFVSWAGGAATKVARGGDAGGSQWRDNRTIALARPLVVVRPNRYERGRAHVAVVNPGRAARVAVSARGVLEPGDRYEVRNVQDLWGAPVASGTYRGADIELPMTGVAPPAPIGRVPPRAAPRTGPSFDVFLLTRLPR